MIECDKQRGQDKYQGPPVVDRIRRVDGFSNFLKQPSFSILQRSAKNGPVIVINVSDWRCDAIILRNDMDPVVVPLPETRIGDAAETVNNFIIALSKGSVGRPVVIQILRDLWDEIVYPVVNKLQELNIPPRSRIWWCPTSVSALLPLHAAGPFRRNQLNLPDIYISSYTPTLSALVESFRQISTSTPSSQPSIPRLLLVMQPETPGQIKIPSVLEELERIKSIVPPPTCTPE
ncbi:hypothetical protein FRC02_006745 [Tulasnella sp. 418]|nr:hypothetical protein FRC02_006745 [Tulasnella sp. 418]